jgi:outer membrane protein TolC
MRLVNVHIYVWFLLLPLSAPGQTQSLDQCLQTALVHNKNLQMSRNNMAISEERQREAKASLLPKITANAEYKYFADLPYQLLPLSVFGGPEQQFKAAQFGVPHNISANIQLTMPLFNPQVYGAIEKTRIGAELSELQYQKTEEEVLFEISNLYYNAQILHQQLDFIAGNYANATRLLNTLELLNAQGMALGTDVRKVQLQAAQLTTLREQVDSRRQQVLNALKFSMGLPIEQELVVDPEIRSEDGEDYTLRLSLDVRMAETQLRLANSELQTLRRSRLPSLAIFGAYGTTGFGYDQQPNDFLDFYPLSLAGLQLSFPLFNGTITQRQIGQKKLELHNSELRLQLAEAQNALQLDNAARQRTVAQLSMSNTLDQILLAQTIYEQTALQQKQGTSSLTDVLLADNALREAQQNYLAAVVDFLKADLELKKQSGNFSSGN